MVAQKRKLVNYRAEPSIDDEEVVMSSSGSHLFRLLLWHFRVEDDEPL